MLNGLKTFGIFIGLVLGSIVGILYSVLIMILLTVVVFIGLPIMKLTEKAKSTEVKLEVGGLINE